MCIDDEEARRLVDLFAAYSMEAVKVAVMVRSDGASVEMSERMTRYGNAYGEARKAYRECLDRLGRLVRELP